MRKQSVLAVLFAGFILNGVVTVLLGPTLPVLMARWSLNDSQGGLFFTAQFLGSTVGVWISAALMGWKGYRPAIALGYLMMGVGVASLTSSSHQGALAAAAIFGCGYGLLTPGTNLYVAEAGGAKRASLLNLLNFTWGVGAVGCPALVLEALRHNRLSAFLYIVAALAGGLALLLLAAPWAAVEEKTVRSSEQPTVKATPVFLGVILGLLFFIYVGVETSMGGWAAALAQRLPHGAGKIWTIVPMFFWAGLLTGRGTAPLALLRVKENRLVTAGLTLALAGIGTLLRAQTQGIAILGMVLAGLGLASLYPIFVAWLSHWYGERAKRISGIMFSLAALGGAMMPWTVGLVSKNTGSLRYGLLVPLAGCVVMLCMVVTLRRRKSEF